MAEGASVGDVYVSVLPDSSGFWAKFQAQTSAGANKVGQELGGQIGKQISDSIVKGIREGLAKGTEGSPAKAPGKKSGEDFSGEFERTVQTRIAAALRALPKAEIKADATDAEKKVQELRASLADLSKHIGVDLSDEQALAGVRRLEEELSRLARESPSIRVTADAARAEAELAAVRREAERLGTLNPNIHIDTNAAEAAAELGAVDTAAGNSSRGMSGLLAAGIALGPGIIPVAAAAAAAVAGIGVGALGAAAGLGVVLLGTRGVGDAVKAMGAADQSAAKDTAQLVSRQASLASASDSVASAQRGLANAQAGAADASRRAAETVANAQTSLAQAEQQALRAEQDLTRAREDARRAMQDLATQVADGALSQRQAQLDLTKAEQELQTVRANPASSQLQRDQAQLTYDQAKQQILDLGVRQQRAQTDLAAGQKAGINGSQQVVAAQDRVAQSQEAVRKAVQSLADARVAEATTARQNAYTIAQATQGVVAAQRSLQQATVAAGTAGGAAMDTLKQKLDALSPAGQAFATFLYGLRPVWLELTGTAQAGFLPGLQAGIASLLPMLPQVNADLSRLSGTVGALAAEAGRDLSAPYWQSFFHFLAGQANTALVVLGHTTENAAIGVSGLARAFAPLGQDVGQGLLRFSEQFAHWSTTLGQNTQFQALLAYIHTEGPIVVDTLGRVVVAVGRIAEAAQPVGGFVITTIRLLADTINIIPLPVLTLLVGGIVAVTTATKAMALVQDREKVILPVLAGAQLLYNSAVSGAGAAMSSSSGSFGAFGTALAGVKGGAQGAATAVGKLGSGLSTGGVIGIGLAAAFIGFTAVSSAIAAQKQRTEDLTRAMRSLHDALNAAGGANKDSVRSIVEGNDDLARAVRLSGEYGINSGALVRALQGEKSAQNEVTAALDAKIKTDERQFSNFSLSDAGLKQLNRERQLRDALKGTYQQLGDNAAVEAALAGQQDLAAASGYRQTAAQQALGNALNVVAAASSTAAQKADALKAADDAVFGAARSADQAAEDFKAAQDRLNTSVTQGTHELGLNTAGSRDNYDALKSALKAADDEYFANIRNGMSVEDATKKHDAQTEALRAQAHQLQLDSGQVQHLIDTYGKVPTDVSTQIQVSGVQAALDQLKNLEIAQISLRQGVDVPTATRMWREQNPTAGGRADVGGHATGGPVFGAGSETSDSIPAWLSNNEHVWTAAEVQAAGGHAVVEMLRRAVLGGALRPPKARYPGDGSGGIALAGGGAVTWPFPVSLAGLWKPSPAELRAAVLTGPAFTGPVTGNITGIQAFIRAQAGKPYIWAAASPQGSDCSGAVSMIWNLAHGKNAYNHTFSTMNEAPYFPLPGFGGVMSAGWTNPGERGPGGNSVGHTAGVFAGLPFESRGGDGFVVGSRVTPIGSFAHVGHFDSGGVLPPGLTIAHNDTGRSEFVLTPEQLGRIGSDGGQVTVNVYPQPDHSPAEIAAMVQHELAWQLR